MTQGKTTILFPLLLALLLVACGGEAAQPPAIETAVSRATEMSPTDAPPTNMPPTEQPPTLTPESYPAAAPTAEPPPTSAYPAGGGEAAAPPTPTSLPAGYPAEEGAAGARIFTLVPGESQATYTVDEEFFGGAVERLGVELGLTETVGTTSDVSGQLELDLAQGSAGGSFSVDLRTLASDQPRRDEAIRDRWLQSNLFPEATFVINSVNGLPQDYVAGQEANFQVGGDMTIREITQPVTLDVTAVLNGDTLTGTATTSLRMTDYGFDPPAIANLFTVGDEAAVQIDFVAREG